MAAESSTQQRILSVLNDVELISKELIEHIAIPKSQRKPDGPDATDLMNLLIEKDNEMKDLLKTAEEQEKIQKVIDALKSQVTKRDNEIKQLQRALKEAETIMATAVYQAKQKLSAVRQAKSNQVSSEDLIKYAHRISASNAVAAPPTWGPGDPRRPYPTDLEMRHSFLTMGSFPESSASTPGSGSITRLYSQEAQPGSHPPPHSNLSHPASQPPSSTTSNPPPFSWQLSQDAPSSLPSHSLADNLRAGHNKDDEVELMSSDSSSSSSSDE